ncbi:MAG: enhancer of mRNA decapping, partial [Pleopsidium flavum]
MAAEFIGLTVLVTLQSPLNAQVHGLVADVLGQQLILQDGNETRPLYRRRVDADLLPIVLFLTSGQHFPEYRIEGSNIADLEVAPISSITAFTADDSKPVAPYSSHASSVHQTHTQSPSQHQSYSSAHVKLPQSDALLSPSPSTRQSFADPAILSFSKPLMPSFDSSWRPSSKPQPPVIPHAMISEANAPSLPQAPFALPLDEAVPKLKSTGTVAGSARKRTDSAATATLTAPFDGMKLDGGADGLDEIDNTTNDVGSTMKASVPIGRRTAQPLETPIKYSGKRSRRGGRGKAQKDAAMQTPPVMAETPPDVDSSPAVVRKNQQTVRSKGWRQTSLIEDAAIPATRTPGLIGGNIGRQAATSAKRKTGRHHITNGEDQNGWATEDATDIQDMGEFDFEGNLSKFDKRTVFDQIRNEDTTADEERLVSFNRRPARPGTAGGKNLHHTENVLDSPKINGRDKQRLELRDSDEDEVSEGRFSSGRSSRRALSRASLRQVSRKSSGITSTTQSKATASNILLSSLNRGQYSSSHATGSPRPSKRNPSNSPITGPLLSSKPSLRMLPTNRLCHCVSPLQMLEVEAVAVSKLGLTDDMMTENAARAIAEVALSALSPGGKGLPKENHHPIPTIVVLAGNHKSGARAIAGGRHLCNHGVRVIVCLLGIEQEEELLESVRRQLDIFRKSAGRLVRSEELSSTLKAMDASAELVVDALLGMHAAFEDLRVDDQAVA